MDQIHRNAERVHICIEDPQNDHSYLMRWLRSKGEHQPFPQVIRLCCEHLFWCRYWSRVWVLQELALAETVTLRVNNDHAKLTTDLISRIENATIHIPGPFQVMIKSEGLQPIEQRLKSSLSSSCTDPKDKIYAVLSLLKPSVKALIPVDCSLKLNDVYANALIACIESARTLELMYYA